MTHPTVFAVTQQWRYKSCILNYSICVESVPVVVQRCSQRLWRCQITPDATRQDCLGFTGGGGAGKDGGISTWINKSKKQIWPSHQGDLAELVARSLTHSWKRLGLTPAAKWIWQMSAFRADFSHCAELHQGRSCRGAARMCVCGWVGLGVCICLLYTAKEEVKTTHCKLSEKLQNALQNAEFGSAELELAGIRGRRRSGNDGAEIYRSLSCEVQE